MTVPCRIRPADGFPAEKLEELRFDLGGPWIAVTKRPPGAWPSHYADNLAAQGVVHAESFLIIDPLVAPLDGDRRADLGLVARLAPAASCWSACSFRAASAAISARWAR